MTKNIFADDYFSYTWSMRIIIKMYKTGARQTLKLHEKRFTCWDKFSSDTLQQLPSVERSKGSKENELETDVVEDREFLKHL